MASLTLKDIPEDVLERLREEARRQHRSLSKQALMLISTGLDAPDEPSRAALAQVAAWRELAGRWTSEQSFEDEVAELRASRTTGRSVDL